MAEEEKRCGNCDEFSPYETDAFDHGRCLWFSKDVAAEEGADCPYFIPDPDRVEFKIIPAPGKPRRATIKR